MVISDDVRTAVLVDWQLIRAIVAVFRLIANPRRRNTAAVVTTEQSRLAVSLIAVSLVRAVATVLGAVADLERQRTVEIVALELARTTVTHR